MVCVALLTRPVRLMVPHQPARVFQSGSVSVPVELFPYLRRTMPPALKKYLVASALANVMVWVNVMVQADVPDPVAAVFDVVPVNIPYSVPDAAALPREPVSVLMSVATALRMVIVLPATGAVRAVMAVP
jgi:hypothetical protein